MSNNRAQIKAYIEQQLVETGMGQMGEEQKEALLTLIYDTIDEEKVRYEQSEQNLSMVSYVLDAISSETYSSLYLINLDSGLSAPFADILKGDTSASEIMWDDLLDQMTALMEDVDRTRVYNNLCLNTLCLYEPGDMVDAIQFKARINVVTGEPMLEDTWNIMKVKLLSDGQSAVMFTIDNTESMSKEVKQQALLEDALQQAEAANKVKTEFLSTVSHDIRTPMNTIIGFAKLASTHAGDKAKVQEYMDKISASCNHLLSLVNDILDVSRVESGRMNLSETNCNLSELLADVSRGIQSQAVSKKIDFIVDDTQLRNRNVIVDKLRLNQVILNLLNNAIKYTEEGGTVLLQMVEKDTKSNKYGSFEILVKDNGVGMPQEMVDHLFDPFSKERMEANPEEKHGLGLSITKNIVDMMGGEIRVTSTLGEGSEFFITLDMRLQDNAADSGSLDSLKGKRILLVEDNELNSEIAAEILSDEGFVVEPVCDGSIAVDRMMHAQPGYYDLILMDVQMPIMNGYDATRMIRALPNEQLAQIPIIAMTANAFEEDKKMAMDCGMNGHLAKPVEVDKLFAMLKANLS